MKAINRLLRRAARTYTALPLPHALRHVINGVLIGRLHFITRHVLRAMAAEPRGELAPALARLREASRAGLARGATFPSVEAPEVSVIIPVFNQAHYTALCLQSIAEALPARSFEIVVVDDASTDHTAELLEGHAGVRVVRNATNSGFIRSCNRGAAEARGRLLLFLNNDTWVVPGWLDALADTFEAFAGVGLVGSKLVSPDGSLQEAGGIIWNDASGWNLGRLQDPKDPEFDYLRDVDYCSGAAIMVPRQVFERMGGFDERYLPAYYEDTDLAFAIRAAGMRVLYQPASVVIHFEGVTSGRDLRHGVKAHQVANRIKFRDKWRTELATHRAPGELPHLEKERPVRRRALVIDTRTPMPDRDSGSIDAFNQFRALQDLGFKVTFIPENLFAVGGYTEALQRVGVECLHAPYLSGIRAHLREHGSEYDLVMLTRVHTAARHIRSVRRHCPFACVLFNTVDLHYVREQRQAKLQGSAVLARQSERTRRKELDLVRQADATIVVSEAERELLAREAPEASVFTLPLLRESRAGTAAHAARRDLLFIGGYEHLPNIDAVLQFVAEVWPLVRRRLPDAEFLVLGSNPTDEVLALEGNGVRVIGYVADLAPWFDRCRLSVAPLRYGAGVKGKIVTSLGFGVPCVATPVAVEGMGLADGTGVLVAEHPQDFADAVARLYEDEALWSDVSRAGQELMARNYSTTAGRERLRRMLTQIGALSSREQTLPRRARRGKSSVHLPVQLVDGFDEYSARRERMKEALARRSALEASLVPGRRPFTVGGVCYVCGGRTRFVVAFRHAPAGARVPNWREWLFCWRCRLNNRTRAALQLLEQVIRPVEGDAIYVTEQCTPLYRWLHRHYRHVTGSEYLGDAVAFGASSSKGIRNESVTRLSFADESFHHILSFDVFEHVPEYRRALVECLRCLKPGGSLLFSVPFRMDLSGHVKRARVLQSGEVEHLLPAEYHGGPLSTAGFLCFWHFGWSLLDEMRSIGFSRASACVYWSRELGYLGGEQVAFIGVK